MFDQSLVPSSGLGRFGWLLEWSFLCWGLIVFALFRYRDSRERAGGASLPQADALRNKGAEILAANTNRPILYSVLRTLYSHEGYIQEEEITATLEEKILSRGEWLRDIAALGILTALFFTFLTLSTELARQPASGADINSRLGAIFNLVGVNWPGILTALICTMCAAWVRHRNTSLLNYYRNWLDTEIFPRLSAARTTVDQLGALANELKNQMETLSASLQPLSQLPAVLTRFQNEVIVDLMQKLIAGLQQVPVSLSETTIQQFRKLSGDSNKLIAQVTRDYGRLVLLSEQSERRQTEIVAGITSASGALQELRAPVDSIVTALGEYGRTALVSTTELRTVANELKGVSEQLPALTEIVEGVGTQMGSLTHPLTDAAGAINAARGDITAAAAVIATASNALRELGSPVASIVGALDEYGKATLASTAELKSLGGDLEGMSGQLPMLTKMLEEAGTQVRALTLPLTDAAGAINAARGDIRAVEAKGTEFATNLKDLTSETTALREAMSRLAPELSTVSTGLGEVASRILPELDAFSMRLEKSTETITKELASAEGSTNAIVSDLKAISSSSIEASVHLRDALGSVQTTVSDAKQSLITSAKEFLNKVEQTREAEKKSLIDASAALQESTQSLENIVSEAAIVLNDALGLTGVLSKQQRDLESKFNGMNDKIDKLDNGTRGLGLLRRALGARD